MVNDIEDGRAALIKMVIEWMCALFLGLINFIDPNHKMKEKDAINVIVDLENADLEQPYPAKPSYHVNWKIR